MGYEFRPGEIKTMIWLLTLFALAIGMLLPLQAGVNSQLRLWIGHPVLAALVSFAVGTVVLVGAALAVRAPWSGLAALPSVPWPLWTGGVLGATFVFTALLLAPRLGAAALIALTVTGQMIGSLAIDHYGLAGYPIHPVSISRVAGAILLLAGVALIHR
jgi:transporter family-2 protein